MERSVRELRPDGFWTSDDLGYQKQLFVRPELFREFMKPFHKALGDAILLLEHVGSTSVPGLSAKPIIDMVLAVADSSDESSYVKPLEEKGYTLRIREPDWYKHRL